MVIWYSSIFIEVLAMIDVSKLFRALADPTRLAVFNCIRCCGSDCGYHTDSGRCCGSCDGTAACLIRCQVPCAPSTLTHHLSELRDAGLIETEKRGRVVYCKVRVDALAAIAAFVGGK